MSEIKKHNVASLAAVALFGVLGLAVAGFAVMWVAGSLSISTAAATQIVTAIEVGGWALAAVSAVFGGGIIGALVATVKMYGRKKLRGLAVA